MNILIFSWRDPKHPLAGGAEQVMHEHMKGWVKKGFDVTLLSSAFKNCLTSEDIDGVKILRKGSQYLGVQIEGYKFYSRKKDKFDLVVDQFHGLPFFTPLYVKKPILAVVQETAREVWFLNPFPFPIKQLVGILGFYLEPLIYKIYSKKAFMTGSESAKNDLAKFGIDANKITVVPHGIIVVEPGKVKKEEKKTVTFLGILTKDKGIFDALDCFKLISEKDKQVQFWIVGKAENENYKKMVRDKIKQLGVEVKSWGYVTQEKKFELLKRSDVLINPSVKEGWGLVNIEANAMSIPVVVYNSAGLVDSVKDGYNGIICDENKPSIMANDVLGLLKDNDKYNQFSQNAKKWSKQFSWGKSTEQSINLIHKIINES